MNFNKLYQRCRKQFKSEGSKNEKNIWFHQMREAMLGGWWHTHQEIFGKKLMLWCILTSETLFIFLTHLNLCFGSSVWADKGGVGQMTYCPLQSKKVILILLGCISISAETQAFSRAEKLI